MRDVKLTRAEWEEIYFALDRKATEIESGLLDDEPDEISQLDSATAQWAADLRTTMAKVASRWKSGKLPS